MNDETLPRNGALPTSADIVDPDQTVDSADRPHHVGLHVRCPHCHNPIEMLPDSAFDSIHCASCGSEFSLASDEQDTRHASSITSVGHFKLIERVGMGAFGAVWKALDTNLDRTVAVKIPRKGQFDEKQEKQFFREAQSAAQLSHPNIVPVFEVGREGNTLYIVSEFVRGITLADWLTGQQLTPREAAGIAEKIAAALDHAHERGVVHRDLKPGNVMVDANGEPHLMDFGLAKRDATEITMSLDGQVIGTPAYMSPEQASGNSGTADRRSDVYSLGVLLFKLLTGELPFRGNPQMLIHQVVYDEPPSPRKLNATVPKDLETITLKCMEKSPERRYPTAGELRADLRRWLSGEPIVAAPVGVGTKLVKWTRRNPTPAISIAAVLLSLLSGIGIAVRYATQEQIEADRARKAESTAASERDAAAAERDKTQQLIDYQTAEYALKDGDLALAFASLSSAASFKSNWEYGASLSKIVDQSRRYFAPIAEIQLDETPRLARLVFPSSPEAIRRDTGWVVLVTDSSVQTRRISDGSLAGERLIDPRDRAGRHALPASVLSICPVAAVGAGASDRRVALLLADGTLALLSVPSLEPVGRGPTGLRTRQLYAARQTPFLVALHDDVGASVIDASSGEVLATKEFAGFDRLAKADISPNGERVAVGSFSVAYKPVIWQWREDKQVNSQAGMQEFSFASNDLLVGKYSWNTAMDSSNCYLVKADTGRAIAQTPFSRNAPPEGTAFGWDAAGSQGIGIRNDYSLTVQTIATQTEAADADAPPVRIDFHFLASSLSPHVDVTEQATKPRLLDLDTSTLGLLSGAGRRLTVYAPQRPLMSLLGGARSESDASLTTASSQFPCSLWATIHRDSTIWSYYSDAIVRFDLTNRAATAKPDWFGRISRPDGLNGKGATVAALAVGPSKNRVWALWEGAETFYHTERPTSKDLMVAIYDVPSPGQRTFQMGAALMPTKSFRLEAHPQGGVRQIRTFFVSPTVKTLAVATERAVALYDAETGELRKRLPEAHSFASSRDGTRLATASWRDAMPATVWDVDTAEEVFRTDEAEPVVKMAIDADGRTLHVGWKSERLDVYDVPERRRIKSLSTSIAPTCLLSDKQRFIGFVPKAGTVGDLVLADAADGRRVALLAEGVHVLTSVGASHDGRYLSIGGKVSIEVIRSLSRDSAEKSLATLDGPLRREWIDLLAKRYETPVESGLVD